MRDRLIELIYKGIDKHQEKIENYVVPKQEWLADYLLENGVIVPPCKVGDTVYCLYYKFKKPEIIEFEVDAFEVYKEYIIIRGYKGENRYAYFLHNIGQTLFLTKEEAEKALKGCVQE